MHLTDCIIFLFLYFRIHDFNRNIRKCFHLLFRGASVILGYTSHTRIQDNQIFKDNTVVQYKPGFHIIAPVATVVAIVEKRVLTQKYFLSDASDTVFPYDRRCRSICLKLGRGDLGSITNFLARIWRYFQNAGRCERRNRRNRLEFLQIPPVTSPDIFKFCLRISGTHVKLFASSSS